MDLIVSSFKISSTKTDYIHALVAWFEVMFVGHKITTFSTGPRSKNTHWKQTVFYFEGQVCAYDGDVLSGSFAIRKNPEKGKNRELDIKVAYHYDGKYPYH